MTKQKNSLEPWWKPALLAVGGIQAALGLSVLAGWLGSKAILIQIHPQFAPAQIAAAVALLLFGLGLVAVPSGWLRLSGVAAGLLLFLGLLSLADSYNLLDLGLSRGWLAGSRNLGLLAGGGPTATSALCQCLAGAALILMQRPSARAGKPLLVGLLATVGLFVNLLAACGFPLWFTFGLASHAAAPQLALQELVGYSLGYLAILAYVSRAIAAAAAPRFGLPLCVGVGGAAATVLLWQALGAQETQGMHRMVQFEAVHLQRQLSENLPLTLEPILEAASDWWRHGEPPTPRKLTNAVDNYLAQHPYCLGVARIGNGQPAAWLGTPDSVRAPSIDKLTESEPIRQFLAESAKQGQLRSFRDRQSWNGQANVLLVYVPIQPTQSGEGGLVAVLRLRNLLDAVVNFNVSPGYALALYDGPEMIHSRYSSETTYQANWERHLPVHALVFDWRLKVWPTRDVMAKESFSLSKVALVVGFLMSSLLALAVRFAQTARRRASDLEKEIAERTYAETALRQSEAKYRSLIENLEHSVFLLDTDLRYRAVNLPFCRERGCTEADLLGKSDFDLMPRDQAIKILAQAVAVLRDGQKLVIEEEMPDAAKPRTMHRILTPVKDDQGRIDGVLGICWDVTEQRDCEMHLRQAQKMEAIGQLAGGVAHDFNNLLTAILGNLSLVEAEMHLQDPLRALVKAAEKAGLRAAGLTNQLLSFSRQGPMNQQPVDLNMLMDEVITLLGRTIDPRIQLEVRKAELLRPVLGDPGQMNQVLMNLCINARDALDGAGCIILETASVEVDQAHVHRHPKARIGSFVRLSVIDTGCGIPPEVRSRIFEPFFTTKAIGKGTGLGLATVFGIVKQHQGWIECHSEVDRGTRFDVYLPGAVVAEEPTPSAPVETEPQSDGQATILVVDDDQAIRKLAVTILAQRGFLVREAVDGVQAVAAYRREQDSIDLVLMDLTMPKLSGQEAFRQILQINPNAAVMFASGYTAEHITDEEKNLILGFIKKPYRPAELVQAIHAALEKARQNRQHQLELTPCLV